ncbi:hypothetical protein BC938DRAFT_477440 [Jimgerdemannia flammicorona]|uniref:Uncharacterized protein n=1 Tax=Jimgerdemannia flammicorona TaxID=994334 RepID=A0A433P9S3_9FUNG|nr:hypothetical protein BC938DRAFT_477440 [Jimgerdemannia flammicorona]
MRRKGRKVDEEQVESAERLVIYDGRISEKRYYEIGHNSQNHTDTSRLAIPTYTVYAITSKFNVLFYLIPTSTTTRTHAVLHRRALANSALSNYSTLEKEQFVLVSILYLGILTSGPSERLKIPNVKTSIATDHSLFTSIRNLPLIDSCLVIRVSVSY